MCGQPASVSSRDTVRRLRERTPERFPEGRSVNIRAVTVTAVDRYDENNMGRLGTVWAQELSPPGDTSDRFVPCPLLPDRSSRVCAMSTFSPTFTPSGFRPVVGDLVDIVGGAYTEFTCASCPAAFAMGDFLPQVSMPSLVRVGVAPPVEPIPVTLDEVLAHYRELMGVLVVIEDVTARTNPDARFGEMNIAGETRTGLSLAPQLTPIPNAQMGTHWDRIVGVVTFFYNAKLLPRSSADLVNQS
jgi:hypothetical protein